MALTINKKATKKKPSQLVMDETSEATEQPVSAEVVDEFLLLHIQLEKHDKKVEAERQRYADLKKQMVAVVDEVCPADSKITLHGTGSRAIEVSGKSECTEITDLEQAKKFLGTKTFWEIAKIGIGDLKAYLTKPQFEQVTLTERTGSRRLKILG